jgi:hypothetical protein
LDSISKSPLRGAHGWSFALLLVTSLFKQYVSWETYTCTILCVERWFAPCSILCNGVERWLNPCSEFADVWEHVFQDLLTHLWSDFTLDTNTPNNTGKKGYHRLLTIDSSLIRKVVMKIEVNKCTFVVIVSRQIT